MGSIALWVVLGSTLAYHVYLHWYYRQLRKEIERFDLKRRMGWEWEGR